ncbi:MAG: hypothetical protein GX761_00835 [Gammaproteobacteria bacterium]|uniref:DUF6116 family protein n=1 Tax=Luteimonas sp. JM171 TaxID=1896164 RepID=UPI0008562FE4|nr:DUF6116 family protein [Luteimonas sp. JM171]AOH36616.1 hypothetical protein BGP89_09830 [Luteimonas sp. JM171]NLC59810.1 hypothetical protein [Gammaproteobacteria bacterium]
MRHLLMGPLLAWLGRLSYPRLFMVTAGLFLLTLVVPDPLPLVDELLLGLGTLLLAGRKRNAPSPPGGGRPPIDGQARRER